MDNVRTYDFCAAADRFAVLQVLQEMNGRTSPFQSRAVVLTMAGDEVWRSDLSYATGRDLHLFPDGCHLHVTPGDRPPDCVDIERDETVFLRGVPAGRVCHATAGARMIVRVATVDHDEVIFFDTSEPCDPFEIARRRWPGRYVTAAALSASGALAAVTLQANDPALAERYTIAILDAAGEEIHAGPAPQVNPPIRFAGEMLIVGETAGDATELFAGRLPAVVQIYGAP